MPIIVTAAKGGSGATTVAAAVVLAAVHQGAAPTLVDLGGDASAAFRSIARPDTAPTVDEWLWSSAPSERLDELAEGVDPPVLAWSAHQGATVDGARCDPERWRSLLGWCARREQRTGAPVVIDAAANVSALHAADDNRSATTLLVTRRCYLGLRRATRQRPPDAVVVVDEPQRALTRHDIERSIGASIIATLPWDPAIARAIDAGLTIADGPRSLRRCGTQIMASLGPAQSVAA